MQNLKLHNLLFSLLLGLLSAFGAAAAARADEGWKVRAGEQLEYVVSYQGALSGWIELDIAKGIIKVDPDVRILDGVPVYQGSIRVTSKPYIKAELVYPFRYSYSSWFDTDSNLPLLVERVLRTHKSNHELLLFDREQRTVQRFKRKTKSGKGHSDLPEVQWLDEVGAWADTTGFKRKDPIRFEDVSGVLDRFSMLQMLRGQPLAQGASYDLPVSNGKDLRGYRVSVEERRPLKLRKARIPAIKLKFEPVSADPDDDNEILYAWLSDDERRLPLRFSAKGAFGEIKVSLRRDAVLGRPGSDPSPVVGKISSADWSFPLFSLQKAPGLP
jgi:hypothetical protein